MSIVTKDGKMLLTCDRASGGCGMQVESWINSTVSEAIAWQHAERAGWRKDSKQKNLDGATGDPDKHLCGMCSIKQN